MGKKGNRDLPICSEIEDLFGLQNYYRGLANFIDGCETPLTIALQGDWGSGKTSMMNNVEARLARHTIINFNTWQYAQFSREADLPVALLSAIIKEVKDHLGGASKAGNHLKEGLQKIRKKSRLSISGGIPGIIGANYELAGSDTEKEEDEYYESIQNFHGTFGKAIADLIKKRGEDSKVVIFIDDLDRLHPARAVEILEVIKLFLDVEGCVFVLSIDYDVVILGIKEKYGEQMRFEKGKSFFDKMIQLPFQIPVNFYKMDKLLQSAFERMEISIQEDSRFVQLIQRCIGSNPRMIKRLLNSFELLVDILALGKGEEQEQKYFYLLFILILQLYDDHLYRYLIKKNTWMKSEENAKAEIFKGSRKDDEYRAFLMEELLEEGERADTFQVKKTIVFLDVMDEFLGDDKITRDGNAELFQSLLQQSQVTSSGAAEGSRTDIIELNKDTALANVVIQGLLIDGEEIIVNTFREVFVHTIERLIDKEKFLSFARDREKTKRAGIPDRLFNEMDSGPDGPDKETAYHKSAVKLIYGLPIVLHYSRENLNKYMFNFLAAFDSHAELFLRIVETG